MSEKTAETSATFLTFDDGLLTIRSKGILSTTQTVTETFAAAEKLVGTARCPMLFDARDWPGGESETWITVIARISEMFSAVSMWVNPESIGDAGSFPEAINRLVVPFQVFTSEAEALGFLEPYRLKNSLQ